MDAKGECNNLKLALINDDNDQGRIDSKIVEEIELNILLIVSELEEDNEDELFSEATWEKGIRIYI